MTTTNMITALTDRRADAVPRPGGVAALRRAYRSELIKLVTVRSTGYLALGAALSIVVIGVANAIAVAAGITSTQGGPAESGSDPLRGSLSGVSTALLVAAALGILSVTADYSTGMIKSTLAAVPRRSLVLLGKVGALVSVVFPVTLGSALLTVTAAKLILAQTAETISFSPSVLRAILGTALYLSALSVFTAGLGWLVRSTAGALVIWLGLWTLPTFILMLLPPELAARVARLLPGEAGSTIAQVTGAGEVAAWGDFATFAAYAVLVTVMALVLLRRRDA